MDKSIPSNSVHLVSAWLAREGHALMTAPPSLVAHAVAVIGGKKAR